MIKKIISVFVVLLSLSSEAISKPQVRSKYFIAIKKNDSDLFSILDHLNIYKPFHPPKNKFYADPILFKHNGINYMFYEDYDYQKGYIAYVTIDHDMNLSLPKTALKLPYHCSFPHIFEDNGKIYMTPETAANGEVAIFEAIQFPNQWKKVKRILSRGWYGDPIIFKHNGYYWLFTVKDSVADLCIHYSKTLLGHYLPHPINEKKIQGRNAGKVFFYQNKLIRPVMNCKGYYGESMTLKEIEVLTPTEFSEKAIIDIFPKWAPHLNGTHTFSINEDFVVYDGRYHETVNP